MAVRKTNHRIRLTRIVSDSVVRWLAVEVDVPIGKQSLLVDEPPLGPQSKLQRLPM